MRRRRDTGMSPFRAGVIAIVVVVIACYFAFEKHVPFFTHHYQLNAVFQNATNVRTNSPVRIAGVNVGTVTSVKQYKDSNGTATGSALVTMSLNKNALPIHSDATLKIRPKLFLEGNFFVQLSPGSPSGRNLGSGSTIPVTQTSAPVQIDQVLSALQTDTRTNLQVLLKGYGDALNGKPLPGEDADQVPAVKGLTAAQALNRSLNYSPKALRGVALVNQATLGEDPHDLSKLIMGTQKVAAALDTNEGVLQDFITNFNRTVAAFAAQQSNLQQSIHLLGPVLTKANSTLLHLNQSFPPTRAWAREILPGVRETPATINASFPWVAQARKLVSPQELGGLVNELRPSIHDLAGVTDESLKLIPQLDLINRCATGLVLPTGDVPIQDGFLTTGLPNYKEFWQAMVGLSSESSNFDGNGQYTRFQPGGGDQSVHTGLSQSGQLFGNAASKPLGTQPKSPGREPPYNSKVACYKNPLPNLNNAPVGSGP
ncbi:MAG TPA: MlaD family protein [Thermoleophilaceae bacterium]|nr:MlaD family protein [Thermoleophilaceae bacterium]